MISKTTHCFTKSRPNTVSLDLVQQVENAILDGNLTPGEKLPPQRELMQTFGASSSSIREAFRVLEEKGLIEIKRGATGGTTVKGPSSDKLSENLGRLIKYKQIPMKHLAEYREDIEGTIAALASERATPKDILEMKELLSEIYECVTADPPKNVEFDIADNKLHVIIAKSTKNAIYQLTSEMIHNNINIYYQELLEDKTIYMKYYEDLRELIKAIEKHEANEAKSIARIHAQRFFRYVKKQMDQNKSVISGF